MITFKFNNVDGCVGASQPSQALYMWYFFQLNPPKSDPQPELLSVNKINLPSPYDLNFIIHILGAIERTIGKSLSVNLFSEEKLVAPNEAYEDTCLEIIKFLHMNNLIEDLST